MKAAVASTFIWDDPLRLDAELTASELALRDCAADLCRRTAAPGSGGGGVHGIDGRRWLRALGDLGLLGIASATAEGGGQGQVGQGLVAREIERIDSGLRAMFSAQTSLVMAPIQAFGTEAQKQAFLPPLARGDGIACFGLAERGQSAEGGGIQASIRPVAGGYRLDGIKTRAVNAPIADVFLIWAKDEAGEVRGALVERGASGLSTPLRADRAGLDRASGDIVLSDVFVPQANVLPPACGLQGIVAGMDSACYGMAWGALGAAESCWHRARQCAMQRKQYGLPLATNLLVQSKLTEMQTEIAIGLHACLRLGRLRETAAAAVEATAMLKRNSIRKALGIARHANEILGSSEGPARQDVDRHLKHLETLNAGEGFFGIQWQILDRAQIGLAAF